MKKIALIVDTVNWAFYNNANNIKKYLSEKYDVTIIPTSYLENSLFHLYLLLEDYDLIHFFWRYELYYDNNEALDWILKEDGLDKNRFLADKLNYDKITTGVYDHLFINDNFEITKSIFSRVKNYTVSSSKLLEIYNNLDLKYKPTRVITDGVNLELFYPINLERFDFKKERKIVIGWVGNSNWSGNFDHKGLKTILDPAIDELIDEGYNITKNYADSNQGFIPYTEMVNYYSKIDILVCSSKSEGTPGPILEAMACGVPVISTDVGVVKDALGKKQQKYILKQRTVKEMKNKIKNMIKNIQQMKSLSDENIRQAEKYSFEKIAKEYDEFFTKVMEEQK